MGSIESQGNLAKAGGPSASRACGRSPAKRETPRARQRPPRPFPPRPARRGFINAGCPLAFAQFVHLPFEGCRVPRKATPLPDYCRIGRLRGWLASAPCCCFSDLHCGGPCPLQGRALALSREQIRRPPPPEETNSEKKSSNRPKLTQKLPTLQLGFEPHASDSKVHVQNPPPCPPRSTSMKRVKQCQPPPITHFC